jgi:hypothetical protein
MSNGRGNSERAHHVDEAGKSGNEVEIERGVERLDVEFIYELLRQTHWARNRPRDVFERALNHSLCFGAYEGKRQVGFARVVTDHATFGYFRISLPIRRGVVGELADLCCSM